jgi:probable rRNA maturation factor
LDITIRIHPKFSSRAERARLVRTAQKALRAEHAPAKTSLSIYITTDAEIHKLNRAFHATDAPTDVLSFPSTTPDYLGDIVVSYETAKRQAHDAGWYIADEIDLLAVHGILHLLGYNDLTPRKRTKMWQRQSEILGKKILTQGETS